MLIYRIGRCLKKLLNLKQKWLDFIDSMYSCEITPICDLQLFAELHLQEISKFYSLNQITEMGILLSLFSLQFISCDM